MIVDHRYHHLQLLRASVATLTYPFQYIVNLPADLSNIADELLASRHALIKENRMLREENIFHQVKLQRLALLERENARLRDLLESTEQLSDEHVLIAEILSVDLHPFKQVITINKGQDDGAYPGQPIVGAKGIIGQLVDIYPVHSTALLISDPNHALLAESNRTNLRALLVGNGQAKYLSLQNVSSSADIRVGDLFHTSGLDEVYPPNYPIAEVISINSLPGEPFLEVAARPLVELNKIREVLLLWTGERAAQLTQATAKP